MRKYTAPGQNRSAAQMYLACRAILAEGITYSDEHRVAVATRKLCALEARREDQLVSALRHCDNPKRVTAQVYKAYENDRTELMLEILDNADLTLIPKCQSHAH